MQCKCVFASLKEAFSRTFQQRVQVKRGHAFMPNVEQLAFKPTQTNRGDSPWPAFAGT
jgi:hypothetical protein